MRELCKLTIPYDPARTRPNKLLWSHWSKAQRAAKEADGIGYAYWHKAGKPRASGPVIVTYTIRRARAIDGDAVLASLKFLTDALFRLRITPDDGPQWVTFNVPVQQVGRMWKGKEEVQVLVEEAE